MIGRQRGFGIKGKARKMDGVDGKRKERTGGLQAISLKMMTS